MKTKLHKSNVHIFFNEVYIENELINIINTIDNFDKLIQNKDMDFDEYINIINLLYDVEITYYDLLKICNGILKKNCMTVILKTNISETAINQVEKNGKFEYTEEEHYLDINIAFTDDHDIDINHIYNIYEITKLVKEKKIVVLDFIINNNSYYNYENDKIYPLNNITSDGFTALERINEIYVAEVKFFLNNYFSSDKLKQDLNEYRDDVKESLTNIDKYVKDKKNNYELIIKGYDKVSTLSKKIRENKINKDN